MSEQFEDIEQYEDRDRNKIALLIDGDNAQPKLIGKILAETGKYGSITIRRIYGDWTTSNMGGWKDTLNNYAVQPIQQFRYTIGKNATDSAMIIDAMDLLHSGLVEGFSIVSSDSDYTRLATRIRERGTFVMGIGQKKTPKAFVNACNIFIFTENLVQEESIKKGKKSSTSKEKIDKEQTSSDLIALMKEAFELSAGEDGLAHLGSMGINLHHLDPSFDPRTYGYKQLSQLIKDFPNIFELKTKKTKTGDTIFHIKLKE